MKRRDFLKLIGVAPFAPAAIIAASQPSVKYLTVDSYRNKILSDQDCPFGTTFNVKHWRPGKAEV